MNARQVAAFKHAVNTFGALINAVPVTKELAPHVHAHADALREISDAMTDDLRLADGEEPRAAHS